MEVRQQTSFIPRQASIAVAPMVRRSSISIFMLIAIIIFIVTVGLAVGVFFYHGVLVNQIADMNSSLVASKDAFEVSFIEDVTKLSKRIDASKQLLAQHVALSPLFRLLEDRTLASVRFTFLNYSLQGNNEVTLMLKGEARSFNSVALQSDIFGQETAFKNPIFSDFNLDDSGNVVFQFKTTVSQDFLLYKNLTASNANGIGAANAN